MLQENPEHGKMSLFHQENKFIGTSFAFDILSSKSKKKEPTRFCCLPLFSSIHWLSDMKLNSLLKHTAAAVLLGSTIGAANALPIITDWSYSVDSIWGNFTPADTVQASADLQTLKWGPKSLITRAPAVHLTDSADGVTATQPAGSAAATGASPWLSVTHANYPVLPKFGSLHTATIESLITLVANETGDQITLAPVKMNVHLIETLDQRPCVINSQRPCSDIFVFETPEFSLPFEYADQDYTLNVFPLPGGAIAPLSDAACAAAGAAAGCTGFISPENSVTTAQLGLSVTHRVPEPGILALLGIGLLGAGMLRRRFA